ncbi:MAG: preprotein translocase subunit SecG [Bacteroides sp.]|nr:preprotein translocase subunit SecG [Bacteroides sp.]
MIYTLVIILTIIAAILLIGVVLIQKSKGGGLGSTFASSNSILGVKRTNDVIEKITWWLAGIICLLSIVSVFVAPALTSTTGIRTRVEAPATPALDVQQPAAATDEAPAAVEAPAAE